MVAVAMAVWKIIETLRNRPAVRVNIESIIAEGENQSTKYLSVIVRNDGRPFHAMDIGILYPDAEYYSFFTPHLWSPPSSVTGTATPNLTWVTPSVWLYRTLPHQQGISYTVLKEEGEKRSAFVDRVYVVDETGNIKTWEIPQPIKQELNS